MLGVALTQILVINTVTLCFSALILGIMHPACENDTTTIHSDFMYSL